jgi:hypothetical protein
MAQSTRSRIAFLSLATGIVSLLALAFFGVGTPMKDEVTVEVVKVTNQDDASRTVIEFLVTNRMSSPIWLVDEEWFIWKRSGAEIEISLARAPMRSGVQVFGYFNPQVMKMEPRIKIKKTIELKWPQALNQIWNEKPQAERPIGRCKLSVRIGYGLVPSPNAPNLDEGVEAPVFRWQREAVSAPVKIKL